MLKRKWKKWDWEMILIIIVMKTFIPMRKMCSYNSIGDRKTEMMIHMLLMTQLKNAILAK